MVHNEDIECFKCDELFEDQELDIEPDWNGNWGYDYTCPKCGHTNHLEGYVNLDDYYEG